MTNDDKRTVSLESLAQQKLTKANILILDAVKYLDRLEGEFQDPAISRLGTDVRTALGKLSNAEMALWAAANDREGSVYYQKVT